ncbi:MAG: alpha-mannosidase [Candidatus Sigynarchaeota archaeon]
MALPKKTRLEWLLEWGYRHNLIVPRIMRGSFKARTANSPVLVDWKKGVKLLSVGNSHIDAAWLWRKEDTRTKKINVTFDRALLHMSMYPEFTYTQNQAVYYAWTKELYPAIWHGIKRRHGEGRWEIVGGDWVECDANMPSLESLVRQRMAGQRFYLEEFGFVSEIAWADDVFGFPHCYPQILAKSGAKYFYTNKFCYNEVNKFPYHAMLWRSPDGSQVLMYWMQHKNGWARWLKTFKELSVLLKPGESVQLDYMADLDKARASFSDEVLPVIGNMYGHGDGGNGPKPAEIIEQLCWHRQGHAKIGTTAELFSMLEAFRDRLPAWNDELYLECHQGTLTSIHMIKENNRTAEVLLRAIEFLNVLGMLAGGKDRQPELRELWKICLFNQFHDVLPGSSIPEVYRDAAREYQGLFKRLYEIREEIARALGREPDGTKSATLTIINDLSWTRGGVVTVGIDSLPGVDKVKVGHLAFSVKDKEGREYPCQTVPFPHHAANREFSSGLGKVTGTDYQKILDGKADLEAYVHPTGNAYLWILVPKEMEIPGFSQREIEISWKERNDGAEMDANASTREETIDDEPIRLANDAISIRIDKRDASIAVASAIDKTTIVKGAGLALYDDPRSRFDAWNIDSTYYDRPVALPRIESAVVDIDGPVLKSALLKARPSPAGTTLYHRVYIIAGQPVMYHDILVDWQEDHKLLKYKVDPAFNADEVRCGTQVGSIRRATVPKNRFTAYKARYEYPIQQWSAVEGQIDGKDASVVLLNRNKYGLFCRGATMELSLLKAAEFEKHTSAATLDADDPRPRLIDRGFWRLSVAIWIGHEHVDRDASWRAGDEFNTPFSSLCGSTHGSIPFGIAGNDGSVSITAVKVLDDAPGGANPHPEWFLQAPDGKPWIVFRLAEQEGCEGRVKITFDPSIEVAGCADIDLLERVQGENNGFEPGKSENELVIAVKPHEVKTVAVRVKKRS